MTTELQDLGPVYEAEKALEQEYFDQAKEALEATVAERSGPSSGGTPFERRAYAALVSRRKALGADEPVAFGRIDLEDADVRYVGKVPVRDANGEVLVYNWQSPAAEPYNLATIEEPQGVARRRVFTAPFNVVESFEDTLFQQLAEDFAPLEEFSTAGDPLLEELGRGRGQYMQDMVRTIAAAQSKLIRSDKDQLLVIQGGPGTGKTAVALHRVSWLLYNFQDELEPQDVLVLGPNPTFTKYIQRVLPDLGDENVVQQSLDQLLAGPIHPRGSDEDKAARLKGSATMAGILSRALYQRVRVPVSGIKLRRRGSAVTSIVTSADIQTALKASSSGTYNERRIKLRAAILQAARRRTSVGGEVDPEGLYDPGSVEAELDKIWPRLSPQQFVRELYGSKDRLKAAGANVSQISTLYRQAKPRIGDEPWSFADLAVLDHAAHAIQGVENTYAHIVVDEAQDLSVMQLKAIRRRSRTGSMTVVGDIAQSTSAYARQNWDQVLKELGSDLPANLKALEVGYRVPRQVFEVAERVLTLAAPDIAAPKVLREVPESPRWIISGQGSLSERVVDAVQTHSAKGLFVGVIASDRMWPQLRESFKSRGLKWSESADGGLSQGINLVSPEDSKGLEFDAVVVVDPQQIMNGTQGARLLYVALTRTVHFLDVVIPEGGVPDILAEFVTTPSDSGRCWSEERQGSEGEANCDVPPHPESTASNKEQQELEVIYLSADQAKDAVETTTLRTEDARKTEGVMEQVPPGVLANPLHEAIGQELAQRIFSELQEEAGRVVQRRVLQLLSERINGSVYEIT